ncbi:MAG: S1/P1 nuclease [Verrucomicrobia bacterium]|nr:S1/P1 nuclease [Verrucomicrobiota bacterium]
MLLPVQSVCAWSGPGHMIVAAVAYLNLNPQERQKAADILKLHYNYEKWKAEVPDKDAVLEEGIVLFMGASKWPDEIKFGNSTWNHKEWHFVDYPLTPLDFSLKPSPSPEDDIIFAIKRCQTKLEDPKVSAKEKAYWLPWLIHIVGDITQPLHCCALVNDDFAGPIGDRGGNSIFVKAGTGKGVTLHKMWDDATGTSKGFHTKLLRGYVNQAIELGSKFKRDGLAELKQHTTPEAWARESWQIAVDQVYLRGKLQYGKDVASAVPLPDGYTKNLKAISLRRVTLGGYRLADLIRECLK